MTVTFTLEALRNAILHDKILVLVGELSKGPLADCCQHAVYMLGLDAKVGALLRAKQPLAIVSVNQTPGYKMLMLAEMQFDSPYR